MPHVRPIVNQRFKVLRVFDLHVHVCKTQFGDHDEFHIYLTVLCLMLKYLSFYLHALQMI